MSIRRHPTPSEADRIAEYNDLLRQVDNIVWRMARVFGRDDDALVDDLRQDILAELWLAFPTYRRKSAVTTWAYRVALNRVFVSLRQRRLSFVRLDESHLAIPEPDGDPLIDRLYMLIDRLDDDERQLMFLYLDKLPLAEIAHRLKISDNAVRQRLKRIKIKLRRMNNEEE